MAQVVVALGSNLGDRRAHLASAKAFLSTLSSTPVAASAIYETEPVGEISTRTYFNAVCSFRTDLPPFSLLEQLKMYENHHGRDSEAPRWSNRTIDLDIIDYDRMVIARQRLHVPHPEYSKRLFVLCPLQEIHPDWTDLRTGRTIDEMITVSPKIEVFKTDLNW